MRPLSTETDDELFAQIAEGRSRGTDVRPLVGELCQRWKPAACFIVRRIQRSYGHGSAQDELEIFQEAVARFVERGLDQFRGVSEQLPGKAASPKTFFLRIAKHAAIDRYRRQREVLASGGTGDDEEPPESAAEVARAAEGARGAQERREAVELYWTAFKRLQEEHPKEAAAWQLYHHEDLEDHTEVASRMNISVVNSYKRVSRAQAWLKEYLLELEDETR